MFDVKFDEWNDEAHIFKDGAYYLTVKYGLIPLSVAKARIQKTFGVAEKKTFCPIDFSAPQAGACET